MNRKLLSIIVFLIAFQLVGICQVIQIRITGKVTDQETGIALPGANIILKGSYTGTLTNIQGDYSILVPSEGSVLAFSFIGYTPQEIEIGDNTVIDVALRPTTEALEEVVITAQAKGQIAARSQQINTNTLKNVVAPDRLQENPDANAVEAIGRLPGISVLRSGGEGAGLVIRGLEPRYSAVTLNGVKLPSTDGNSRNTNISGISQYALQGVEVFKALTPDMEANSVAGAVNLTLQEAPKGLQGNIMVQGGYNHLNNYFGNYKILGAVSNRFLENKLGIIFSTNAERVNRGVETLSADYGIQSTDINILLNNVNLNKIYRIRNRASATLSMDYQVLPSTKLKLYGLYTNSSGNNDSQSIGFGLTGSGGITNSVSYDHGGFSETMQTSLSGKTNLGFLNLKMDYGLTYSKNITKDPGSRNWQWTYRIPPPQEVTTIENRTLNPEKALPLFISDSLKEYEFRFLNQTTSYLKDENVTANLNIEIPFTAFQFLKGHIKFGGMYRKTDRNKNLDQGYMHVITNQYMSSLANNEFDWIENMGIDGYITGKNFNGDYITEFLGGDYHFGHTFRYDRLNQFTDWWLDISEYYWNQGPEVWQNMFGSDGKIGLTQNIGTSILSDQNIIEDYYAGYLMSEINIDRWAMLLPGLRYEETDAYL